MKWFSEWPLTPLKVESRKKGCTVLVGPGVAPKIVGGGSAGVGGMTAGMALPLAVAFPFPFNLIPLGAAALGGAIGATGLAAAFATCRLTVAHNSGLWLRWRVPPLKAHELFVAREDIERFALEAETRSWQSDSGFERTSIVHVIELATVKGKRVPLAVYETAAEASECLREISDALLRRDEPIPVPPPTTTPAMTTAGKAPPRANRRKSRRKAVAKKAGPKRKPRPPPAGRRA